MLSLAADGACGSPRVAALTCQDALRAAGAEVSLVTAGSDAEVDEAITVLEPGRKRARVVVACATDSELRAVLRRLVRRYAPTPGKRPDDLPADRTLPDLPPIGVLPLDPSGKDDLAARLGLPRDPGEVARAVIGGQVRRLDLFRTDAGSVTLHGALLGGATDDGQAVAWHGRIDVDDACLSDGSEPILACAVVNAGASAVDGLPLVVAADPADGRLDVAVAVPVRTRSPLRRAKVRIEVRRARGRAVAVTPREDVPYVDDGVTGTLTRKRTWWMERAAWAVYTP